MDDATKNNIEECMRRAFKLSKCLEHTLQRNKDDEEDDDDSDDTDDVDELVSAQGSPQIMSSSNLSNLISLKRW